MIRVLHTSSCLACWDAAEVSCCGAACWPRAELSERRCNPYFGLLGCWGRRLGAGALPLAAVGPGLAAARPVGGPPVWDDVSRGELPPQVDEARRQSCTAFRIGQSNAGCFSFNDFSSGQGDDMIVTVTGGDWLEKADGKCRLAWECPRHGNGAICRPKGCTCRRPRGCT